MEESLRYRLNKILKEKGWTRYRLSKESGIPASTIYNIFKNDADVSFKNLCKLGDALGSLNDIVGRRSN